MNSLIVAFYVNELNKELLNQLISNLNLSNKQDFELEIEKNSDSDILKSQVFPDGFLYYPLIIRYYKENKKYSKNDIFNSTLILKSLWNNNIPAVAACDFEDELPEKGGYKNLRKSLKSACKKRIFNENQ